MQSNGANNGMMQGFGGPPSRTPYKQHDTTIAQRLYSSLPPLAPAPPGPLPGSTVPRPPPQSQSPSLAPAAAAPAYGSQALYTTPPPAPAHASSSGIFPPPASMPRTDNNFPPSTQPITQQSPAPPLTQQPLPQQPENPAVQSSADKIAELQITNKSICLVNSIGLPENKGYNWLSTITRQLSAVPGVSYSHVGSQGRGNAATYSCTFNLSEPTHALENLIQTQILTRHLAADAQMRQTSSKGQFLELIPPRVRAPPVGVASRPPVPGASASMPPASHIYTQPSTPVTFPPESPQGPSVPPLTSVHDVRRSMPNPHQAHPPGHGLKYQRSPRDWIGGYGNMS